MNPFKILLFLMLIILAILFSYYNLEPIEIRFFNYSLQVKAFLVILGSFTAGFLIAIMIASMKNIGSRKVGSTLKKSLKHLWTGYEGKAENSLRKMLSHEEIVPLYLSVAKSDNARAQIYLQRYSLGIVETTLAQEVFRKDINRSIDLLEKALGKNWNNLRARRMLRSLYFINGDREKALDLQKSVIEDTEKERRERERRILSSMLAEMGVSTGEIEKEALTPLSCAVLAGSEDPKLQSKFSRKIFDLGFEEVSLPIMAERSLLNPAVLSEMESNEDKVSPVVKFLVYSSVGRLDKVEELREDLPAPYRDITGSDLEQDCVRKLMEAVPNWECGECGKEFNNYTPVCVNCLSWNNLKIIGGSRYADRLG